ncbi:hypothetical protein V490_07040 [Pseudogymnoascus sp. VKM F-3557]|nr:hypothetical protein V490_07040 [Pseudogymnoascus sp. VKM F-3557]
MAKYSWKACFRRKEETVAHAPQVYEDSEQPPRYSESQNQEQRYKNTDQSPSNTKAEKLKIDQQTKAAKIKLDEEFYRKECYNKQMMARLYRESNDSLEKLKKPDLVDFLDMVREEALTPSRLSLADEFSIARGESPEFATPSTKAQNMSSEKLSGLDLVEPLRLARVTPYYRLPKSELMRVPNSDLVDLLREAHVEYMKRYRGPAYEERISRYVKPEESPKMLHEDKLQEANQVSKPKNTTPTPPSETELELKRLKETIDKLKLECYNRLDDVEKQVATMKTALVERKCVECWNVATENDIAAGCPTESVNKADSNSQIEEENDPINQARDQAKREVSALIAKADELYNLLFQLYGNIKQDETLGALDFDFLKMKAAAVNRDHDDLISRVRKQISLLQG